MLLVLLVGHASLRGLSQNYSIDVKKFALLKLFLGDHCLLIFLWPFSWPIFKYVWIDETVNTKCMRMKTDTGETEEWGNCEELQNYVCEKPASAISKYKSC